MDLQLRDKIIIVIGGAKGIGEGICNVLANENTVPVIIGRNKENNEALVAQINAAGRKSYQVVAELSKPEQCDEAVKKIIDEFGRIHGLVNNAGVNDGVGLEHGSYEKFMDSLHSNLVHYYLIAH